MAKSILYLAKTLDAHRIPLLGVLDVAAVKYPGWVVRFHSF